MGACGCTENSTVLGKMPGPDNTTYVLRRIPSCDYCEAGPQIDVLRIQNGSDETDGLNIEAMEDLEFHVWGVTSSRVVVTRTSVTKLRAVLREGLLEFGEMEEPYDELAADTHLDEGLLDAVMGVISLKGTQT